MSKKKNLIISILVVVLVVGGGWFVTRWVGQNQSNLNNKAVAKVNGEKITKSEFKSRLSQAKQASPTSTKQAELKKQVLDQMISRELVEQKAQKKGVKVKDSEVQTQLDKIAKSSGGQEKFKQQLKKSGLTQKELKKRLREQLLVSNYLKSQVPKENIEVTDKEVKSYYNQVSSNQEMPELEKVKSQIKSQLVTQKRGQKVQSLIDSLRKKAEIKKNL